MRPPSRKVIRVMVSALSKDVIDSNHVYWILQVICSLSPAEEWKWREAKFSQKWSRDRGLGMIAQFVQCSKNFFSLGCLTSSTLFPTLPPLHSNCYNAVLLSMQVNLFSLCTNFLAGIWCCDKSINLLYSFYSDKFVLSWSKIEHRTVAELYWNYWMHTPGCNLIPLLLWCNNSVRR